MKLSELSKKGMFLYDDTILEVGLSLKLTNAEGLVVMDESYPFSGELTPSVDIREILASELHHTMPSGLGIDTPQLFLKRLYGLSYAIIDESPADITFIARGFSEAGYNTMSRIDELRVPKDYIQAMTICKPASSGFFGFMTPKGKTVIKESCLSSEEYPVTRLMKIPDGFERIRPFIADGDGTILASGPILHLCAGHFEQYMFANRFGGFDNIPMSGALQSGTSVSFQNGIQTGTLKKVSATSERIYKQNSGFMTQQTIAALAELIESDQIYHLRDDEWQKIVITNCEINTNSQNHLHSMSFEYRYSNTNLI